MKYVLGLTGKIGAGKSFVGEIFRKLGVEVLDADKMGHELLKKGTEEYVKITKLFPECVDARGAMRKERLVQVVFAERAKMKQLEKVIWPGVLRKMQERVRKSKGLIVIEAALLLQAGLGSLCDEVWVVVALREVRLKWLTTKRKMKAEEALRRIEFQEKNVSYKVRGKVKNFLNLKAEETETKVRDWFHKLK